MRPIFAFVITVVVVIVMLAMVVLTMGTYKNVIPYAKVWIAFFIISLMVVIFTASIHRYRWVEPETALVRLGGSGLKIAMDNGMWYNTITHNIMEISLGEIPIEIKREGANALITYDFLSVDIECTFLLRVQAEGEGIRQAVRAFASEPMNAETLQEMFEAKFDDALRTIAAQTEIADVLQKREEFARAVQEIASENLLERYGLIIENILFAKLRRTVDYVKLRNFINRRVEFNYDTGAKIVGRLIGCLPKDEASNVQLAIMEDVDIFSGEGEVLAHHDEFSLVPNMQVGFSRE